MPPPAPLLDQASMTDLLPKEGEDGARVAAQKVVPPVPPPRGHSLRQARAKASPPPPPPAQRVMRKKTSSSSLGSRRSNADEEDAEAPDVEPPSPLRRDRSERHRGEPAAPMRGRGGKKGLSVSSF